MTANPRFFTFTPWVIVREQFFGETPPHSRLLAKKYNLDVDRVRRLYRGETILFWEELCTALSRETGMSRQFFRTLSWRFLDQMPPTPIAPALALASAGPSFQKLFLFIVLLVFEFIGEETSAWLWIHLIPFSVSFVFHEFGGGACLRRQVAEFFLYWEVITSY